MASYSMKAVMQLTGLSADRLRVWERRYGLVKPTRSASGRRTYGEGEVKRLKLLAELVRRGHSIGLLSAQTDRELSVLLSRGVAAPGPGLASRDLDALLAALDAFDAEGLRRGLARARHLLSPRDFAFVLVPELMAHVGSRIESGRLSVAQEHTVSDLVRHVLRQHYDDLAPLEGASAGTVVLAAPEGHLHDFGVLLAALLFRFHGFTTHFLGANMPAEPLAAAARALGASVVVLGISRSQGPNIAQPQAYVQSLASALPKKTALWLGGPGSGEVQRRKVERELFQFDSLEALSQKLETLRGGL